MLLKQQSVMGHSSVSLSHTWLITDLEKLGKLLILNLKNINVLYFYLRYLNAIQTMCPHILRYLTTAVITNKDVRKRRQVLKDLVKVIQQVKTKIFIGF